MTDYTNEQLDQAVSKLADYVERNYNEMINPKHSTLRSSLSIIFYGATKGVSDLHKTAAALGIEVTSWHATLDKIIEATEARGSNAADRIKAIIPKTKELDKVFAEQGIGNKLKDGFAKIRLAKKLNGKQP